MGTGFAKRKKEAKKFQDAIHQMGDAMRQTEVTGQAGNGLVQITMTGDHNIKSLKIDPQCVDPEDVEGLEVLIKAAFKNAQEKLENERSMPEGLSGLQNLAEGVGLF